MTWRANARGAIVGGMIAVLALLACRPDDPRCPEEGSAIACDGATAVTCEEGRSIAEEVCGADEICADDAGCAGCAVGVPAGPLGVAIDRAAVGEGEAWRTLGWTRIDLDGAGSVAAAVEGPFELFGADALPASAVELPGSLWVRASGHGDGRVVLRKDGCDAGAEIALRGRVFPGLSAIALDGSPVATHVDAFLAGGSLRVAVDPARAPEAVGAAGSLWVVADRDRDAWLADPALVDVAGGPTPFALADGAMNVAVAWGSLPTPDFGRQGYDLVWDVDGDGRLGAGDRLDGLDGPGFVVYGDLSAPGPHGVATADVNAGPWLTQRVWWPSDLAASPEPAPLVVISHGNGHEHTWYDYLGEHLASFGYVVMSHRNNTGPGVQSAATTTLSNTDAFVREHAQVHPDLEGRVDVHRVAWIGHSRGGEGVLIAWDRLLRGVADVESLRAEDIALISSIAPTVFEGPSVANPGDRPFHLLSGSADGDVTGGVGEPLFGTSCPMCQWWRLKQGAVGPVAVTYLHGAAHNDFVTDGFDDGSGIEPRFGKLAVQAHTRAVYLALLDHVLKGDAAIGEFLRRMPDELALPRPPDAGLVGQYRSRPAAVRVLDDFQAGPDPEVSAAGTAVRHTMSDYVEGRLDDGNTAFAHNPSDAMNGMTESHQDPEAIAARGAVFGWSGEATWEVDLPEDARDLTRRTWISLRIAQATRHPSTLELDGPLVFGVALIDGAGREVVVRTSTRGGVHPPFPRTGLGPGAGWANEFQTVSLRLTDFERDGFDPTDARTLRLYVGPSWGSPVGRVGLDDVLLEDR